MQTTVTNSEGRAVLRLLGRFDFNTHRDFRAAVESATALEGVREIVVDLGGVEYLDSSALGMLLMLRDRAHGASQSVSLDNCRGAVKQVLDIANFSKLFTIK